MRWLWWRLVPRARGRRVAEARLRDGLRAVDKVPVKAWEGAW